MDSSLLQFIRQNAAPARFPAERSKALNRRPNASGFFLIGNDLVTTKKLVRIFRKGYMAGCLQDGKAELLKRKSSVTTALPEIIICVPGVGNTSIREFARFLQQDPELSFIPFVMDGSTLLDKSLAPHPAAGMVDEIIRLNDADDQQILSKTRFLLRVKSAAGAGSQTIEAPATGFSNLHAGKLLKRSVDVVLSAILLCLLMPVFLLIALAISLESMGPVFTLSRRAGMGYRVFDLFSFRTSPPAGDLSAGDFAPTHNLMAGIRNPFSGRAGETAAITRTGAFLQRTGLDQLPQLLNVLLGDMSIVGNRPLPLHEAAVLTTDQHARRFLAPAGITGLWQIRNRGRAIVSPEERIKLDIDYANKYNFMYDMWIMVNTLEYPVGSSSALRNKFSSMR